MSVTTHILSELDPDNVLHGRFDHSTPHFDLNVSWRSIVDRIPAINELIKKMNRDFLKAQDQMQQNASAPNGAEPKCDAFYTYLLDCETIINLLHTTADQLLCLASLLADKKQNGQYSDVIQVNSIGKLIFEGHRHEWTRRLAACAPVLREINSASNGLKHSFMHLQMRTLYDTPGIDVYYLKDNKLTNTPELCSIMFECDIPQYNEFLAEIQKIIHDLL